MAPTDQATALTNKGLFLNGGVHLAMFVFGHVLRSS
jgi:hypothetical protein